MLRLREREIDQAIIDEVDRPASGLQDTLLVEQVSSIGHDGLDPVPFEEALRQDELWMQVLRLGIVIDDRHALRGPGAALP